MVERKQNRMSETEPNSKVVCQSHANSATTDFSCRAHDPINDGTASITQIFLLFLLAFLVVIFQLVLAIIIRHSSQPPTTMTGYT